MMRLVELQVTNVILTPTKGRGLCFEKYLISFTQECFVLSFKLRKMGFSKFCSKRFATLIVLEKMKMCLKKKSTPTD